MSSSQETQREILQILILFGFIPDPVTQQYRMYEHNSEEVQALLHLLNGTPSSDAKLDRPTTPQSIPVMDTTALSNSIYKLGAVMVELDTLINILMESKEKLQSVYGWLANGVHGRDVVTTLGSDDGEIDIDERTAQWLQDFRSEG